MADLINGLDNLDQRITVVYNVDTNEYYTEKYLTGELILYPTSFTPSKTGYTFVGWRSDTIASATVLADSTVATSSTILYAVFKKTLTASYNGNGNTGGSTASTTGIQYYNNGKTSNPSVALASNGFTKTNYTFSKWAKGSATGTEYAAGTNVTLSANTTFYAKWIRYLFNKKYVSGGVTAFTKQSGAGSKGACSLVEGSYFRMTSQWVSGQSLGNITCKSNSISIGSHTKLYYLVYIQITSTATKNQVCKIDIGGKSKSFTMPTSRTKFEGYIDISSLSGSKVITLDLDVGIYNYNNNKATFDIVQLYLGD